MVNTVSAGMAVILRALYEAAGTVDRAFTAIGLRYDISVPGVDAEEVSHRGVYPWYPEDGESLRFYCMEIGLPHPIAEVTGYPSEIRLYLGVKPHEQGFTVEASIEVDLNTPLYRLPAGEHKIMSRVVEETTVPGVVAAIGRCRDAFAEHYGLFDDIGFPAHDVA